MNRDLNELEKRCGYTFQDKNLFHRALTHSSYANEHKKDKAVCNERLEFLGDAVLEVVSSDFLYHKYPEKPEGELSKIRASLVCEPTLAYCAADLELGSYLLLGKGHWRKRAQFRGFRCYGGSDRFHLSGWWFC
jgi:ribonuclease-3